MSKTQCKWKLSREKKPLSPYDSTPSNVYTKECDGKELRLSLPVSIPQKCGWCGNQISTENEDE